MTVAISGGTGVVGSAVLRHLVASDAHVRAVVRSDASGSVAEELGAEPVPGDILDHGSLVSAFSGCDTVFHVAGVNEMCSSDPEAMYRANVDGTRTVLRACDAAGVRRLVYTSSAVTMGEAAGEVATEEPHHRGVYLSAYERSKHHAEMALFAERTQVEVVAVNPSSVQGPGRASGTGKIILDVLAGRMPVMIESTVSIVDIDDCARGHLLAAERGRPGERYLLSGFRTTVSEALRMAGAVLGRPVTPRMVPAWLAGGAVRLVWATGAVVGRRPPFCPEMMRVLRHGHRYDGSKASRDLGLGYVSAEDTISRMVTWFVDEGLLEP